MAKTTWKIDTSHSSVAFTVRHMMIAKVRGQFAKWQGTITLDDDVANSSAEATMEVASLDTHEAQRDGHLKSADFFDAEKHPTLTFKSTRVEPTGKDHYRLTGDLTIRGTTKPVTLEVESLGGGKDPWGNQRVAFAAKGSIDRRDFGLTWNQALEAGGVLVSEKVDLDVEVQAVKA
ncbi:MAG TPA: YceI family protein [Minicystis sp.]|nr:YceI family protein [Minicystis sp.]